MPRPTDMTLGAPDSFGPSATPTTQLNVVAPLDVTAAPSQGDALAKALGVANQTLQAPLRKDQIAEGKKDATEGQADQILNQVDPDKMANITGYAAGAHRISVEQSTLQALNTIETKAHTDWANDPVYDTTDVNGNVVPGVLSKADAELRTQLSGLETDPDAARVMAPLIQRSLNTIAGQRISQQIEQTQQSGIDNATALAVRQASRGDGSFNWNDQFTALTQVYQGDKHKASMALVHAVGQATIQAQDPTLPDKLDIPDKITFTDKLGNTQTLDGPMYVPGNAQVLEEAKAKALELQTKSNHAVVMSTENQIAAGVLQDKDPTQALLQYSKMPGATPAFLVSMSNFYKERDKAGIEDDLNSPAFASVQRDVLLGNTTTAPQLVASIEHAGLTGKAYVQAMQKGLDGLRATQTTNQDDPAVRGGVQYLDSMYRPGADPITGKFNNTAAVGQHAGVIMDYRGEVEQLMKGGKSSEEASNTAMQDVQKKWGDPVENPRAKSNRAPVTDVDRAAAIMSALKSPEQMAQLHVNGSDIKRLRDIGYLTPADAETAARAALAKHQP